MCFRYFYLIEASVWVLHSISPHFSLLFPPRLLPFYHFCVRLYPFTLFYCISSFSSVFLSYRLPSSFSFPYLFVFRILTYLLPLHFSISSFLFSTTSGMTLHGSLSHFFVHLFVFPILSFFFFIHLLLLVDVKASSNRYEPYVVSSEEGRYRTRMITNKNH